MFKVFFPQKSWLTKFPSGDQIFALVSHLATEKKYINQALLFIDFFLIINKYLYHICCTKDD
jgi:hypothetical protein